MVPSTEGDLGMISGRKHDPFGNKVAGVEQRVSPSHSPPDDVAPQGRHAPHRRDSIAVA